MTKAPRRTQTEQAFRRFEPVFIRALRESHTLNPRKLFGLSGATFCAQAREARRSLALYGWSSKLAGHDLSQFKFNTLTNGDVFVENPFAGLSSNAPIQECSWHSDKRQQALAQLDEGATDLVWFSCTDQNELANAHTELKQHGLFVSVDRDKLLLLATK